MGSISTFSSLAMKSSRSLISVRRSFRVLSILAGRRVTGLARMSMTRKLKA